MHKIMTLGYVQREDKTLLLYRNKKEKDIHKGKWNGLGGKLEFGETPEECIVREISEETNGGIVVKKPLLKGRIVFCDLKPNSTNNAHLYIFVITDFSGDVVGESDEGKLAWVTNDEFSDLPMWDGDKVFLPWLKQDKFFSAKFIYDGQSLVDHTVVFY